jgi:anti-sigma factor RsiW
MAKLGCLWNRSRLVSYTDRALGARASAAVARHVERCAACAKLVSDQQDLRTLLRSAAPGQPPDWSGFWPAVQRRVREEAPGPPPIRDPWWLPVWKPVWGHPRVAFAGLATGLSVLALTVHPFGPGSPPAVASPVVVQDATTADPDASVMIYSDEVTVIWLLSGGTSEAS